MFHTRPHTRTRTLALCHLPLSATLVWSLSAPLEHFLAKDILRTSQKGLSGLDSASVKEGDPLSGRRGGPGRGRSVPGASHTVLAGRTICRQSREAVGHQNLACSDMAGQPSESSSDWFQAPRRMWGVGGNPNPQVDCGLQISEPSWPQAASSITLQAITSSLSCTSQGPPPPGANTP